MFERLGPKYNIIFTRARSLIPNPSIRILFNLILSPAHLFTEKQLLAYLKEVGTYTLSYITSTGNGLEYMPLNELQNLSGYDSVLHQEYDVSVDTLPFTDPTNLDALQADSDLLHNVEKVIDNLVIKTLPHTLYQFLSFRDNINIHGASTVGSPLVVGFYKDKDKLTTRKFNTKYFNALGDDDSALTEKSLTNLVAVCEPFLKLDEASKSRTVIAYDTYSFFRCSYLESFIHIPGKEFWSTLEANPIRKNKARQSICQALRDRRYVLCVDQSSFDQHQSKSLVIYALTYLFKRIQQLNPQTSDVIAAELTSLNRCLLYTDDKKVNLKPWNCGLLSGYKFTALLGSLLNRAEFLTVCQRLNIAPEGGFFQGDDAISWFKHPVSKQAIVNKYAEMGLVVNPLKTWYGTRVTEFLREIYTPEAVYGMPSRCALSLIFHKPKPYKLQPEQLFAKNISNLQKATRRGLSVDTIAYTYIYWFLSNHYFDQQPRNFNRLVRLYMSTPVSLGGAGLTPFHPDNPCISLKRYTTTSDNYKEFTILSKIKYKPIPDFDILIRKRLKDRIQVGNVTTSYRFIITRYKTLPQRYFMSRVPPHAYSTLPPSDWNYPGNEDSATYYANRLSFSLNHTPLPPGIPISREKDYLRYVSFINKSSSLDDYITTQESHLQFQAQVLRYINSFAFRIYHGFANLGFATRFILSLFYSYYKFLYKNHYYKDFFLFTESTRSMFNDSSPLIALRT